MTDADAPMVTLDLPRMAVCDRHGEPFRKGWPKGYAAVAILTLEFIQENTELGEETEGNPERIPDALRSRPVCERVPAERLMALYLQAEIAVDDVCIVCGRRAPGTEYQRSVTRRLAGLAMRRVVTDRHVCFDCVLTRTAPA